MNQDFLSLDSVRNHVLFSVIAHADTLRNVTCRLLRTMIVPKNESSSV